jgi:hypothetical protein
MVNATPITNRPRRAHDGSLRSAADAEPSAFFGHELLHARKTDALACGFRREAASQDGRQDLWRDSWS